MTPCLGRRVCVREGHVWHVRTFPHPFLQLLGDMPFSLTRPHKHSLTHSLSVHPSPSHTLALPPALTTSTSHTPSITYVLPPHYLTHSPLYLYTLSHPLFHTLLQHSHSTSYTHPHSLPLLTSPLPPHTPHSLPLLTGPASQRACAVSHPPTPSPPQSCDPEEIPPPPCWDLLPLGQCWEAGPKICEVCN